MWFVAISWGLFGCIIGSFLNVLIVRHNTGRGIHGRSACAACGTTLQWYELIPVVSYLVLRGRCRTCGSRVSLQYPSVELLTGVSLALIGTAPLPLTTQVLAALIAAVLIMIAVYDLHHTIIPDAWVFFFIGTALIYHVATHGLSGDAFLAALWGGSVALPLLLLWLVSRGAWMGFGDVKLAVGMGIVLGFAHGIEALFLAFVIGAVVGICILLPLPQIARALRQHGITALRGTAPTFTMKSEVPFGPFLILGFSIIWFLILHGIETPQIFVGLL